MSNVDVKIKAYEQRLIDQLSEYTYSESLSALEELRRELLGYWDDIIERDGKYVLYDYKRTNRGELVGDEVSEDDYAKNVAIITVIDAVNSGKVQVKAVEDAGLKW